MPSPTAKMSFSAIPSRSAIVLTFAICSTDTSVHTCSIGFFRFTACALRSVCVSDSCSPVSPFTSWLISNSFLFIIRQIIQSYFSFSPSNSLVKSR